MKLVDLNGLYPTEGVTAAIGAEMSGQLVESAPTAGISSVLGEALEGEDTYTYDRDAAIEYAEKWSNSMTGWPSWIEAVLGKIGIGRNKDYYSYRTNCANFVSQCLYAGGIEQNDSWHSNYPENKDDIAPAWRLAQEQYNYFSNEDNGYINGDVIKITSADEIAEAIDIYDIQKGDLMYFIDEDGKVHHATIISNVTDNAILYSGNTKRRFDYSLGQSFKHGEYGVYIVRIKDQIEAVSEEDECGQ